MIYFLIPLSITLIHMCELDTGRVSKLCTFLNLGPNILGRAKVYSLVHLQPTPTPDAIVVTRVVMHPLLLRKDLRMCSLFKVGVQE